VATWLALTTKWCYINTHFSRRKLKDVAGLHFMPKGRGCGGIEAFAVSKVNADEPAAWRALLCASSRHGNGKQAPVGSTRRLAGGRRVLHELQSQWGNILRNV
jgi:hypothetical protein